MDSLTPQSAEPIMQNPSIPSMVALVLEELIASSVNYLKSKENKH